MSRIKPIARPGPVSLQQGFVFDFGRSVDASSDRQGATGVACLQAPRLACHLVDLASGTIYFFAVDPFCRLHQRINIEHLAAPESASQPALQA